MAYFNFKKKIFPAFFMAAVVFILFFDFAKAFSVDDPADSFHRTYQSIFRQNPFYFSPIDITKFIKTDRANLTFKDLVDTGDFSSQDIGASIKAILILFIRLVVTTLNVTLGILRVLLEVLTRSL